MATSKRIYITSSREVLYEGNGKDADVSPSKCSDVWYEGTNKAKAMRIASRYAADTRDTGKVEVCKGGVSRNVFEVCAVELDEDGDYVGEDTVVVIDPLDRMSKLRNLADKADNCNCQLPSYITGKCKHIDYVSINGKCYGLYRFELSAFGDFSAYTDNGSHIWLPATFFDYGIETADQLKDTIVNECGEWWQDWQGENDFDGILYKLFDAEV